MLEICFSVRTFDSNSAEVWDASGLNNEHIRTCMAWLAQVAWLLSGFLPEDLLSACAYSAQSAASEAATWTCGLNMPKVQSKGEPMRMAALLLVPVLSSSSWYISLYPCSSFYHTLAMLSLLDQIPIFVSSLWLCPLMSLIAKKHITYLKSNSIILGFLYTCLSWV